MRVRGHATDDRGVADVGLRTRTDGHAHVEDAQMWPET